MSNYIIGLQYLVHVGGKCIRSVFRYLSQCNGYWTVSISYQPQAVADIKNGLYSPLVREKTWFLELLDSKIRLLDLAGIGKKWK